MGKVFLMTYDYHEGFSIAVVPHSIHVTRAHPRGIGEWTIATEWRYLSRAMKAPYSTLGGDWQRSWRATFPPERT